MGRSVNASLKFPENQRFEIVGFLALFGRILWFDPRREYSSIPTASSRSRRAQGLSRVAASSRPPAGLGLDWHEHGGILNRIGAGGAHHIIGKFKPLVLGEIHAAGDTTHPVKSMDGTDFACTSRPERSNSSRPNTVSRDLCMGPQMWRSISHIYARSRGRRRCGGLIREVPDI